MQEPTSADEVAKLLKEAMSRGHVVVLRTSPPTHVDARTPLLIALNQIFQLLPAESRVLVELMEHGRASREALHVALSPDGNPVSKIKVVDVVVCKLRGKLAPHGIEIATVWRLGYALDSKARDKIRKLLAKHDEAIVATSPAARAPP
jgi:DNA-binding response OmpR family regulator